MSDPSSSTQPSFSQGVDANSPAQFNLSFPPQQQQQQQQQQTPNNVGVNNSNNAPPSLPPGVNPQFLYQNGNFPQPPSGMNGSPANANGNGQPFDQAALQARIALAQQMAQAGMQQHNQQEQRVNGAGGESGHERKTSGSGPQPGQAGSGDWAQLANAANAGMMQNVQATTREALMKQLQALQSSHAAATRNRLGSGSGLGQSPPAPSPGLTNNSQPSPLPQQSPLHPDNQVAHSPASAVNPASFRAQSVDGSQQRPGSSGGQSMQPATPSSSTAPGPPMRSTSGPQVPIQADSPIGAPTPTSASTPVRPPGYSTPRPGHPITDQRKQFLQSVANWHKSNNLPPPPELFNSERLGAIKMGDTWVEIVEMFLTVMRMGGIDRLAPDSPFWQAFCKAKSVPNPLPTPLQMPAPHGSTDPPEMTTDPVRYLIRGYMVWLYGFEQHMNTSKMALAQRQAKMGSTGRPPAPQAAPSPAQSQAPVDTSSTPQASAPSPAVATPAMATAPTPTAPTPNAFPPTQPQPQTPTNPGPQMAYPQGPPMPPQNMPMPPQQFVPPYSQAQPQASTSTHNEPRHVPPPIKVDTAAPPSGSHTGTPTTSRGTAAKRGRKRKDANSSAPGSGSRSNATSRAGTPAASTAPAPVAQPPVVETPVERPKTPKRARYKVEYRPLHLPQNHLAGWDDRAAASTFPKNNVGHPSRSIHELGIVDMEAVLMGLRSRLPGELGYGLTVLSMLSMGSPEEHILGLPLAAISEIYVELLELLSEAAFGEDGYDSWSSSAPKQSELNDMTFGELERLGRDFEFGLDERKDTTGGQTDIVLTCLNLLRNFSILPENCQLMTQHPEIFELLAHLTDGRLCRLPISIRPTEEEDGTATVHHQPFSLYEFARVRRDVITVLSNLGSSIDLRRSSAPSIQQAITVISSFLSSGWSTQVTKDSIYGIHAHPPSPTSQHSVNRAVEAFCKLSWSDANREVLSKLPADQLVQLFESMIKLLPVQRRHFDLLYSSEEYLCQTECLALSLYSLAFLAPLPTRSILRNSPGRIGVITRIIFDLSRRGPDFRANPYAVLVRRLAETLGILNGTNGLESDESLSGMSFGAGVGAGKTTGSRNKVVERGWLAEHEEKVMESMGIRGIDVPAFIELDNLWWAGGD